MSASNPNPHNRRQTQIFEKHDSGKGYHRMERNYGAFVRSFAVPNTFDPKTSPPNTTTAS